MAFFAKRAGLSGQCCDCSQYVNCDCGGAGCAIQCRSKAENAELCGYPEFGALSDPPKKYRKKTWAGTMHSAEWSVAGCPDSEGEPVSYNGNIGTETNWGDASGSVSAEPVEIDVPNNRVKYRLTAKSFSPNSTPTALGTMGNVRLSVASHDGLDSAGATNIGDEFWLSRSGAKNPWEFIVQGDWSLGGWIGNVASQVNIDISKVVDLSVRDVWDITNEFANAPGCATTENDESTHHEKAFGEFPLNSGGDEEEFAGFGSTPLDAYGDKVEITEQTSVARTTAGKDACQGGSAPYYKARGEVTETLENEDTEEDATARAVDALEWNTTGPCANHTTYIAERGEALGPYGFGFRIAQARAQLSGLVPSQSYTVTFRIWRRVFDSHSAYAAFQEISFTQAADAETMYTEWIDIPVQHGYETRVMSCSCVAV